MPVLGRQTAPLLTSISNRNQYPKSGTTSIIREERSNGSRNGPANANKKPVKTTLIRIPGGGWKAGRNERNEDIDREPDSSDSEFSVIAAPLSPEPTTRPSEDVAGRSRRRLSIEDSHGLAGALRRQGGNADQPKSSQEFGSEDSLSGEKRTANVDPEKAMKPGPELDDELFDFFSSQPKRPSKKYSQKSSQVDNIHAGSGMGKKSASQSLKPERPGWLIG